MIALVAWTVGSAALLVGCLLVHTRVRGFLPEDPPGPGRKRHPRPTPMAGAAPAALTAVCLLAASLPWLALAVATAGGIGLADDVTKERGDGVPWTVKALVLLIAAACAALSLADRLDAPMGTWVAIGIAIFAITNATNFLDNQDGVAAGLGATALALIGGLDPAAPATALAGIWLAFLPFNWPRARLFLGDAGAYALGVAIATLALRAATAPDGLDPLRAAAPVAVFVVDFVQVLAARLWLGYAPWIGDRRHLTHVLLTRGVPRVALAPCLVAAALTIGLLAAR